ncbi:MAG: ribosomal protein S18-alanine N-acetyltransferase [Deltaproteobacteria bacterium]|jgi:ribosomal-protein-alanine N-acetyltransferase
MSAPGEGGSLGVVRELRAEDVEGASALGKRSFTGTEQPDFAHELVRPISRAWVAADREGGVVGYVLGWVAGGEAQLMSIAVEPGRRERGIGRALLARFLEAMAEERVTDVVLEVRAGNLAARSLYEAFGFEMQGVRARYYADGEDGVTYHRAV